MTTNILSDNWRGLQAAPIDPDAIRFTATESLPPYSANDACKGCLFRGQRTEVCNRANAIAASLGLPDCGDTSPAGHDYVFVLDRTDPRQIDLLKGGRHG